MFPFIDWIGMEEMSMSGSATHPPAGISQAFLAALAARGRPPAPGSGSGPYNNPNVGEVVGSTGHNVGLSAVNGSDSSSALAQNGRGRDVEPYPSSSYSPAVHRTATISPLNPTPAVTSSMSELD